MSESGRTLTPIGGPAQKSGACPRHPDQLFWIKIINGPGPAYEPLYL